jgi:hypothetical protein
MSEKSEPKNCFVIMPIGEESSDTRRRSDQVLKHIIKPGRSRAAMQPFVRTK